MNRCGDCKHYKQGECLRFPPSAYRHGWGYPRVGVSNWACGEFKRKAKK